MENSIYQSGFGFILAKKFGGGGGVEEPTLTFQQPIALNKKYFVKDFSVTSGITTVSCLSALSPVSFRLQMLLLQAFQVAFVLKKLSLQTQFFSSS